MFIQIFFSNTMPPLCKNIFELAKGPSNIHACDRAVQSDRAVLSDY